MSDYHRNYAAQADQRIAELTEALHKSKNECNALKQKHDHAFGELRRAGERIAELEARIAEMGWRPIESAPRDGTRILLAREEGQWIGWWRIRHEWELAGPGLVDANYPTHWMPLPSPPSTEVKP